MPRGWATWLPPHAQAHERKDPAAHKNGVFHRCEQEYEDFEQDPNLESEPATAHRWSSGSAWFLLALVVY